MLLQGVVEAIEVEARVEMNWDDSGVCLPANAIKDGARSAVRENRSALRATVRENHSALYWSVNQHGAKAEFREHRPCRSGG